MSEPGRDARPQAAGGYGKWRWRECQGAGIAWAVQTEGDWGIGIVVFYNFVYYLLLMFQELINLLL